jgi:dihydrofolate synthase/folylpolyglutamate synthase
MPLTYEQALDFLFPRTTTIKFGLATTRALLRSLGNPHEVMPSVHIGGTNGKGSVSTLVASALAEAGWRVGLYTSPHLVSFRERMRVDGVPISEAAVAMWTDRLRPRILQRQATFFEATTAIAFADFAARGVEIAVVEVGLGGRLDSTNVVRPLVSAVTKIERDHMKYLGDTLERIACEKAGIAKPGAPFVIGERDPAVVEVLRQEAHRAVARLEPGARADVRVLPRDYEW